MQIAQQSPERRRHKVLVTRNTEYHFRDRLCVAVRDRRTGDFMPGHLALKRELAGGVHRVSNGTLIPKEDEPQLGEALYFIADGLDLVTSPLLRVERPQKEIVKTYRF
ncbi:MAG: hypothetical protein ACXVEF_05120 [Polyangiales bacterium]